MLNYDITNKDLDEHGHLKEIYPREIDGNFNCAYIDLSSLQGIPQIIGGNFRGSSTKITSLEYGPQIVRQDFYCSTTKITSLEYAPVIVGRDFYCSYNKITSLEGIGKRYLKEIGRRIYLNDCPIVSNMLGLILVKRLKGIYLNTDMQIEELFNRHISTDRDILECQEELIDKGFKEYAKL